MANGHGGKRAGAGRPTYFTKERADTIIEALEAGNWFVTACRLAGMSANTVREWIKAGETSPSKHPRQAEFAKAVQKALGNAENDLVLAIRNGVVDDPALAQWLLEKRFPKRWAKSTVQQVELSGPDGGPIKTEGSANDALNAKLDALAARLDPKKEEPK